MNETMRVRLKVGYITDGSFWPAGSEIELTQVEALKLLEADQAEAIKQTGAENASLNP